MKEQDIELMKLAEKVSQDSVWMWSKDKPKE
nr:MAG TPA: hypothetical protein [Caudoviricetes sp.]